MYNVCTPALIAKHAKSFYKFMLEVVKSCAELSYHWNEVVDGLYEDIELDNRPHMSDIVRAKDMVLEGWCLVTMMTMFRNGGLLESSKRGNAIRAFLKVNRTHVNELVGSDTFWRVTGPTPELKRGEVLFSACFPYPPEDTATNFGVPLKFDTVDSGFRVLVSDDIQKKDWRGSYYLSDTSQEKLEPGDELVAVNGTRIGGSKEDILEVLTSESFPRHFDFIRDSRGKTMKTAIRASKKPKKGQQDAVKKAVNKTKGIKRAQPAVSPSTQPDSVNPRQPPAKRGRPQTGTKQ
jgi:hypothetical protein